MDDTRIDRFVVVRRELERFQRTLCHPAMPPLAIIHATDRRWSDAEYRSQRPDGFPSRLRGVYLLHNEAEELQYVGLAMWSFDKRVWSHDADIQRRLIDIVPFADAWLPLAPALEFWLIQTLNPPGNTTYRGYGVHEPIPSPANEANA